MSDELPPMWALDMAAEISGAVNWKHVTDNFTPYHIVYASTIAHARTLAKYEKPPVDEAELKRRQDAREAASIGNAAIGLSGHTCDKIRNGLKDGDCCVISAYEALCREHGVTPTPVSEWSDK